MQSLGWHSAFMSALCDSVKIPIQQWKILIGKMITLGLAWQALETGLMNKDADPWVHGESCCWLIWVIIQKRRVSSAAWSSQWNFIWVRMTELGQAHPALCVSSAGSGNKGSREEQGKAAAPESKECPGGAEPAVCSWGTPPAPPGVCHSLQGVQGHCQDLGTAQTPTQRSQTQLLVFLRLQVCLFLEMVEICLTKD